MNRITNSDETKKRKKRITKNKNKISSKHGEDFNTGSHSPSALRNVGAGYDDTGLGNNSSKTDDKNVKRKQSKNMNSQRN